MRRKIFGKYDEKNEAFERYLHAIGTNINELNKQMVGVD